MPHGLKAFFEWIHRTSGRAGKAMSLLVFIIMVVTTLDVAARYVFNHPLVWGWLTNRILFGVFILFAGVYTLFRGEHIRIEILYDHFPGRMKKAANWIALAAFASFVGVLVWQASWMGWNSLLMGEKAAGAFRIPLYPFKLLIPVVAFLFLLEGIAVFIRDGE